MISYVRGELVQAMDTYAVLDVNGFGLRVFLTGRDLSALPPNGEEVRLHTYFLVRMPCSCMVFCTRMILKFISCF